MKKLTKKISIIVLFSIFIQLCTIVNLHAQSKENLVLENPKSWTMVLLPDPQTYSKFEKNQPILEIITAWIKDHKKKLNIELVMCTGDLVEQNNIIVADSINGDQNSSQQWKSVSNAFGKLDNVVPYILCLGNHDFGIRSSENRYSQFNSYFPVNRNPLNEKLLVHIIPNQNGAETLENAFYKFVSPHGVKFLIASLEFNPRKNVVKEASEVFNQGKYNDCKGIVLTHSYMNSYNQRIKKEDYALEDVTHGEDLWQKLIAPSSTIEMVFCGHSADSESHRGQVGYRVDKNKAGIDVHQMMFNAQREGGGWHGNGGDGWIRILEFFPDKQTVVVKTFSPFFALSPTTMQYSLRTEDFDQYTFKLK
jgi:predicted MPP superfamily phosphohydrolase